MSEPEKSVGIAVLGLGNVGSEVSVCVTRRETGAKTFYFADGVWVDSLVDAAARGKAKKIAYLSDDYFALLKAHPEASSFLAIGEKVAKHGSRGCA